MEVNITCIVQIGHVIIAYYMLKKFLLKPLVTAVQKEDSQVYALQEAADRRKILVKQQEQAAHNQWIAYQQEFSQATPSLESVTSGMQSNSVLTQPTFVLSAQEKTMIVESLKQEIVTRVERVY